MSADHITITATSGVRFNVRILTEGDAYGASGALIWEHEDRPGVEFYDARHPFTPLGQFVSRYFVDDILDSTAGLDLYGGEPSWKIDPAAMYVVRRWLLQETARSYVVGVPLAISVDRKGNVTFDIDLAEVGDFVENEPDTDTVEQDRLTVEAAAARLGNHAALPTIPTA
jgi:hypothetical protein